MGNVSTTTVCVEGPVLDTDMIHLLGAAMDERGELEGIGGEGEARFKFYAEEAAEKFRNAVRRMGLQISETTAN